MDMTHAESILLYILTVFLIVFFLLLIVIAVAMLKLISKVREVVEKAESVIISVESAAEVFKNTEGKFAAFKLIRNIFRMVNKAQQAKRKEK
jgi:hypothetical protein